MQNKKQSFLTYYFPPPESNFTMYRYSQGAKLGHEKFTKLKGDTGYLRLMKLCV